MGREVRRVPADWTHPTKISDYSGEEIDVPLHSGPFSAALREWEAGKAKWDAGERPSYADPDDTFEEMEGRRPVEAAYMPEWPEGIATHYMMYETTSEGTPISPAFATPEELARWLTDNNASAFAGMGASYDGWLRVCRGGFAPSMVSDPSGVRSGVDL